MTIGIGAPRHTAGNKEPCPPFGGGTRFSGYGPGYLGSREPRRDEVRTVRDVPVYSGGKGVAVPEGRGPEAEDMCIDSTSAVTVTRVLTYSARAPRLYGYLSGFHSVTATSY